VHELSIAQSILDIVDQYVPADRQPEVKTVRVQVGDLSGVVVDSLSFCFSAVTAGTPLEQAALEITAVPLEAECRTCRNRSRIEEFVFLCPACGGSDLLVTSGRELQVTEIELADEPSEHL
jgi:hydrogenase nickel incorporation protein HypA/HybF